MAETAATVAFFFSATPSVVKLPFCPSPSRLFSSAASAVPSSPSSSSSTHSWTVVRSSSRDSGGGDFISNNPFSFFPWDSSPHRDAIEWVQEERVTLFTADGLIQIGGSIVPREASSLDKQQGRGKPSQKFKRFQEQDYMDPNQGLCLGALFDIAATNGLDMGRRLCIFGFCRSVEMLSDVVEDAVLEHGGEVVAAEKASDGGLQEKLTMTVAVPLLWGVPPASETLHFAVRNGGGIVDKIYWQWDFL